MDVDLKKLKNMNERIEKNIEAYLNRKVKQLGGFSIKTGKEGFPDRTIFFKFGLVYLVETKALKGKPRKLQKAVHRRLEKKYDLEVFVLDSKVAVDSFIFQTERELKYQKLKYAKRFGKA